MLQACDGLRRQVLPSTQDSIEGGRVEMDGFGNFPLFYVQQP
jgi:hypothetical protein